MDWCSAVRRHGRGLRGGGASRRRGRGLSELAAAPGGGSEAAAAAGDAARVWVGAVRAHN